MGLITKIFGTRSQREIKKLQPTLDKILALEEPYRQLSDEDLRGKTAAFKARLDSGETLDDLLPEAFAAIREASDRVIGLRPYPVQLLGGIVLHQGRIAEMKTGEGKTLVAILPSYLNALTGKGVHVVTVNDYLAKYQSEWMGKVYKFMGLTVGLVIPGMTPQERRVAYAADITYCTNNELGFDYLRDNMALYKQELVQRGHYFAIVDEVDSILIDEARTPLIISGKGENSSKLYEMADCFVSTLRKQVFAKTDEKEVQDDYDCDYFVDEKSRTVSLTASGIAKAEKYFGVENLADAENTTLSHHINQAMKARGLMKRDIDYVVKDGQIIIVDEFTGRLMYGRRYNEGLHQAIEAKEGVIVREENQTLATITLQNYFLMYDKLSGMTGTAMTEDSEFREVYHIPVQVIPPNKPVIRVDHDDLVYRSIEAKFNAVAEDVTVRHANGQPCLVGTVSIENSERLSRILDKRGIKHSVLNAKFHEREAQIVAQAGREGAVTIATNMAGRGTDILLGGNPDLIAEDILRQRDIDPAEATPEQRADALAEAKKTCSAEREHVVAAGGLCVIGTERHESRRIDNQLRGRSGRQGDPRETQFYLSLEDDLMRLFGGDRLDKISDMMVKTGMPDDQPIQAKMVTKAVESAQRKVEEVNFAMRKNVLDYDNVMNTQRQVIYEERNKILDGKDLMAHIDEVTYDTVQRKVEEFCPESASSEEWDVRGLMRWLSELTGSKELPEVSDDADQGEVMETVDKFVDACFAAKAQRIGEKPMHMLSSQVMLRVIDTRWMSYLQEMDYLKTGIGLRGFGQRDPLVEYKSEAYAAFSELVNTMYEDFLRTILRIEVVDRPAPAVAPSDAEPAELRGAQYSGPSEVDGDQGSHRMPAAPKAPGMPPAPQGKNPGAEKPRTYRKSDDPDPYANVGRNEPCPCGSGKKFKNCHGRNR